MCIRTIAVMALLALAASGVPAQDADKGLIVHEWGVSIVAAGADAPHVLGEKLLAGLPPFVVKWEDEVAKQIEEFKRPPDLEGKPVVYFYAQAAMRLKVHVSIPTGRPHAWWPPATGFGPTADRTTKEPSAIKPENGFLEWNPLFVDPKAQVARAADGWWAFARKTDATPVQLEDCVEKFLFYDALTVDEPPVAAQWKGDKVEIKNSGPEAVPFVWAVRVKDGKCRSASCKALAKGASVELSLADGKPADFADVLVVQGLYRKEADAFVETWKKDFFETEGVRVLAALPQEAYDRMLPLTIEPAPKEIKRVMISDIECLDEEAEARIRNLIEQLGSDDPAERDTATGKLKALRPLADGLMSKALETEKDAERRGRLLKLLGR